MERKRPEMYYLDSAIKGWYVLDADGSASDVIGKESYEVEEIPSRVPGLNRPVMNRQTYIPERGDEYVNLRELASVHGKTFSNVYEKHAQIDESELIYTPPEVIAEMRKWQAELSERINASTIAEAARDMVAADEQLQNEQVACKDCQDDQYACRTSGWSKKFWKYPLIDIGDNEQKLVPLDIARAVSLSPDALSIEDVYMDNTQELSYVKRAIVDLSKLSASYVGGDPGEYLVINKSDKFADGRIAVEMGYWQEAGSKSRNQDNSWLFGQIQTSADVMKSLQSTVTQAGEVVEVADYDKVWSRVRADLGRRGLALMWEWKYFGPGDPGVGISLVKDDDITKRLYLGASEDARMAVDSVYDRLINGNKDRTYSRPNYDDEAGAE